MSRTLRTLLTVGLMAVSLPLLAEPPPVQETSPPEEIQRALSGGVR